MLKKGGTKGELIKDWRPITLLSQIYKLISGAETSPGFPVKTGTMPDRPEDIIMDPLIPIDKYEDPKCNPLDLLIQDVDMQLSGKQAKDGYPHNIQNFGSGAVVSGYKTALLPSDNDHGYGTTVVSYDFLYHDVSYRLGKNCDDADEARLKIYDIIDDKKPSYFPLIYSAVICNKYHEDVNDGDGVLFYPTDALTRMTCDVAWWIFGFPPFEVGDQNTEVRRLFQ